MSDNKLEDEAGIYFLTVSIDKANSMVQHIDSQINILVSISIAIFVFATTKLAGSSNELVFTVMGIFAALSSIVALYALHPPRFMRKRAQKQSILLPSHIARVGSAQKYEELVSNIINTKDDVVREGSLELYNLSRYYYLPKRWLYRLSRNLLLGGLVIALAIFIAQTIYY